VIPEEEAPMIETIQFTLNGRPARVRVDDGRMLLWVLRTELGLTGTKFGCGEGYCGACTVLLNNEPVRSCQLPMKQVQGQSVVTIEGLAREGTLHPLQKAFVEHEAMQCGYCTSGMILTAYGLLLKKPKPSRREILDALDDNLCRCGAHKRIVAAVEAAAAKTPEGKSR
jgi:aerobic-type carbon monoxide dehydrogenase small subunit (CoxS/CutS family)